MEISKTTLAAFRTMFADSVKGIEKELGVKIGLGSISYGDNQFTSKVTVVNVQAGQEGKSTREIKAESDFKLHAFAYGLKESDLGKTFKRNGKVYTIIGCSPKSHKYPILCKQGTQTYKLMSKDVVTGLTANM